MPESKELGQGESMPLLSVVTPVFNESENLKALHDQLRSTLLDNNINWEWILVDDHSPDNSFEIIQTLASKHQNIRGVRLAQNAGSHMALACGIQLAQGQCTVVIAGDLQDPPQLIPELLKKWKKGAGVVWAAREKREGEKFSTKVLSQAYYWIVRKFIGIENTPVLGADFFLLDRRAADALNKYGETNVSILALIARMGFQQETIFYNKRKRGKGKSGWTLEKKLKLVIDSLISFTYKPIRLMSYLGGLTALAGFGFAIQVIINAIIGNPTEGWTSLMVVILLIGGIQMIMLGVLGEYLWRTLDESRLRPRFLIEKEVGFKKDHNNSVVLNSSQVIS
jgi:glycosyltransferase involved in cell wall biosynthesis